MPASKLISKPSKASEARYSLTCGVASRCFIHSRATAVRHNCSFRYTVFFYERQTVRAFFYNSSRCAVAVAMEQSRLSSRPYANMEQARELPGLCSEFGQGRDTRVEHATRERNRWSQYVFVSEKGVIYSALEGIRFQFRRQSHFHFLCLSYSEPKVTYKLRASALYKMYSLYPKRVLQLK